MQNHQINENYWNIDDILMEEALVTVKCNSFQRCNGFLDKSQENEIDIQKDQEIELPFWLALDLASCKIKKNDENEENYEDDDEEDANLVDINIPSYFNISFQESISSDPVIMNIRDKNEYFYEFGMKIAEYLSDASLVSLLEKSYLCRIKEFIKISQHPVIKDCNNLIRKMANFEQKIFNMGRIKSTQVREWKDESDNFEKYNQAMQKNKNGQVNILI